MSARTPAEKSQMADLTQKAARDLTDLLGPEILRTRRSPHAELVGAGASEASEKLLRLDSNQQPFD